MSSGQHIKSILRFEYLPAYADFLLKNKLDEFVTIAITFSKEEELSILKYFESYTAEQLLDLGRTNNAEMLGAIANNESKAYINRSLDLWRKNQLPGIDQGMISTDDITLGALVRRKTFRYFVKEFTKDEVLMLRIMEEVDRFTSQTELLSYNVYIEVQQEKLKDMNADLLEAQNIAEMGSFVWNLTDPSKSVFTPTLMKIFGMSTTSRLEEFIQFVHTDDQSSVRSALDRAFKNKEIYECDYRYIRNGFEIHIASRGVVEFNGDTPVKMNGTVRDITKKHKMLKHLNDLNSSLSAKNTELERTNQELESFNYIASHDLQEPLRKIMTFSGRVIDQSNILPKNIIEYVEKISISSLRMQSLIEDLLSFSQITSASDAFEEVDLNIVLHEATKHLCDSIERNSAVIEAATLPKVNAVPFQLSQLFINLIGNSIKYKKDNVAPRINISSRLVKSLKESPTTTKELPGGSYIQISFKDNGIGFDAEYKEKIFELFKRLHARDKYSGTGIGLSICKKIVHNHNGYIEAESEYGNGSSFHIYLPAESVI